MLRELSQRPDERDRLEDKARAQGNLAQGLRHLRESEDWQVLRQSMLQAKRKVMEAWTNALLRGEAVNQRQIDYDRGYWDGIMQVLEAPDRALEQFEKTFERLEKLARQNR